MRLWRSCLWHSAYYTRVLNWDGLTVVTIYNLIHERFPPLFNRLADEAFRRQKRACILAADALICISEATRAEVLDFYGAPSQCVWAVPLAASPAFRLLPTDQREQPGPPFILCVGERVHYKNLWAHMLAGLRAMDEWVSPYTAWRSGNLWRGLRWLAR